MKTQVSSIFLAGITTILMLSAKENMLVMISWFLKLPIEALVKN